MGINYSVEDVTSFCCLARCGQYTAAAEQLCVTVSALSRRIVKLEEQIGGRLFDRTTRRVALTALGSELYERLQPLLQQLDGCMAQAARTASGLGGTLRISAVASVGYAILPRVLPGFQAAHPNVYLSIRDGHATATTSLVENREVEFGVTTPVSFPAHLSAESVGNYGFHVIGAPGALPPVTAAGLNWRDLVGLPVVGLSPLSSTRLQVDSVLLRNGITLPWTVEVDQLATLIGLVRTGQFLTVMPALFRADDFGLQSVPVGNPEVSREIWIVTRRDTVLSPQAQGMLDLIRQALMAV